MYIASYVINCRYISGIILYKMKYWREFYLAKHIENGGINIDKITSYVCLKSLQLGVNFNEHVHVAQMA